MTSDPRCTIPTAWRSITPRRGNSGAHSAIRGTCRSAPFRIQSARLRPDCRGRRTFIHTRTWNPNSKKRPSLWAEPIGDWGRGRVQLIEIPTKEEIHDKLQALAAEESLQAKGEHTYTYRLHWGPGHAPRSRRWSDFLERASARKGDDAKIFVLDLIGERLKSDRSQTAYEAMSRLKKAEIKNIVTQPNRQPAAGD